MDSASKPRVLIYTDCGAVYGVERWINCVLPGLLEAGFEVECAVPAVALSANDVTAERMALGVRQVPITAFAADHGNDPSAQIRNHQEAGRVFTEFKPDLVVFVDGSAGASLAAKEQASAFRLRWIVVSHIGNIPSYIDDDGRRRLRSVHRHAQTLIAVSEATRKRIALVYDVELDKVVAIANGCPDRFFDPYNDEQRKLAREKFGLSGGAFVPICVARAEPPKDHLLQLLALVEVLQMNPAAQIELAWVGGGNLFDSLMFVAKRRRVDQHIHLLGFVPDVREALIAADAFVLTTGFESVSFAMLEAMACALPVIASSVGGIPDALGDSGVLLPAEPDRRQDAVTLLANTWTQWESEPDSARQLGRKAFQIASVRFRASRMSSVFVSTLVDIFNREN